MSLDFKEDNLIDLCELVTDGSHHSPPSQVEGYYMASVKDMGLYKFNYSDCRKISKEDYEKLVKSGCSPKNNDILIAKDGSPLSNIFIYEEEYPMVLLSSIAIIRTNENKILPKFLKYYLQNPSIKKYIQTTYTSGSVIPRIILKDFKKFPINYPNIRNQNTIINILETIDKKIEVNENINKNLVTLAKTIFRDKFIFYKGYESQMIKTDVGEIPNTFEVKSVDEISIDVVCGKTPSTKVEENYGDKMPFITIPDMHGNVFVIDTERKLSEIGIKSQIKKILPENSICVSCIATAGLVSLTSEESQTNQQINSIICKEDISPYFVYLYMKELSEYIKMLGSGGSTTLNLNKREFGKIELVIPPKEDMIEFHGQISPLFEKIKSNQYEINFLSKLRDTLLPKLMSGEIDVSKINCDL